ncbi:hypothetical protein N8H72_08340 [Pseudomonas koreensis]|uniref:hypothetical protein n=1 Tax=Pseudomonas koreensis TaxID=198620 RepID=UPI0021C9AF45|nr:hypothetical protein [Pseudomonas koreensis]MCU0089964.1 hypothetical protein [Pseudomonas koreensis]
MDGLLDLVKTPAGQGLLAAAFGGLAGARRGAPVNTLGAAGLAGIAGYSNALQRQSTDQYRDMQAQQIQANLKKQNMAMDMAQRMFGGQSMPGMPQGGAMTPDSLASPGAAPSSMPQTQGRQPQGAFPLGLNDVAAYNMLDLPNGSTIFDLYKQANNPQERKGGNYYVDPRTGQQTYMPKMAEGVMMNDQGRAMPVPGAAQANAGYKGAEAGSVAAAQFLWAVGQKAAEQRGAASYDPMKVIGQDGNEYFVPRLDVAAGAVGAAPGQGGGFMAGRNPVNQSATQDLNKNWITSTYQPTLDSGKAAGEMRNSIRAARNIDLNTGYGTEAKALGANVLTSLGIAPKNAELFATNAQKFQSVAMDRLLTVLGAQKGPQTEGDADRASKTFVSLKNTPEANTFILDLAEAKANQDARKAQFYQDALPQAQKEGDLMRIDREWRNIQGSIWNDPILSRWQKR